jgi:hypothetical protein
VPAQHTQHAGSACIHHAKQCLPQVNAADTTQCAELCTACASAEQEPLQSSGSICMSSSDRGMRYLANQLAGVRAAEYVLAANTRTHRCGGRWWGYHTLCSCTQGFRQRVHNTSITMICHPTLRRSYLMALDRSEVCSKKYTSEAACMADTKNRCFWSKVDNRGICLSADYAEVCGCCCCSACGIGSLPSQHVAK